jgi:hypothetical protein
MSDFDTFLAQFTEKGTTKIHGAVMKCVDKTGIASTRVIVMVKVEALTLAIQERKCTAKLAAITPSLQMLRRFKRMLFSK